MINIKLKGKDLDLYGNTSIAIERKSPIWFGDSIELISGTVTIPFEIPLTKSNISILDFVHHFGNRKNITQFEDGTVEVYQNTHLAGILEVEEINKNQISLKIFDGVGALQVFKTKSLNDASLYEVDDYYDFTVADLNNSLSGEDVIYLPFWNGEEFENEWDADNQTFLDEVNVIPTFSALFILEKLLIKQGWNLVWQDKAAFENIYLLSNRRVSFYYNLTDILPSVTAAEFIKQLAIATGHYIDIDSINKILTFRKYSELGKGKVIDITNDIISIDAQEFLNFDFDFDTSRHVFEIKTESETKTYGSGTIIYHRDYLIQEKDLVTSFLNTSENLTKVHFFQYDGLEDSEYILGTGSLSDVESLKYPAAKSLSGIANYYEDFLNKVGESKIITAVASLSPSVIKSFKSNQIVRIFNANDGNFYEFLIKSIKQSITSQQHGFAELQLVLLK